MSRDTQNLCRVENIARDVYMKARYCYVYAYNEEALVDTSTMVLHFLDSLDKTSATSTSF